jgi:hypothetical protein
MKQGFVTVYGKLIIENNTLFIRNVEVPFSRSMYARVLKEIFIVAKRDYANRIPLQHIVHYSTKDHLSGLEVDVILQLKNGRYRKIAFRKLEHQHESFIELLSQYLSAPKFA